jgi:hypothetical protein
MFYGSSTGTIQVYNRTGSAYLALNLSGLTTNLQASGTTILEANAAGARIPAGKYLNFGATANSSGYGFRDNSGVMEKKNSGGSWEPLASTNSLIAEAVTVTSSTSYAVTDTDLNIIYEGATGATMTLPTGTSGRVLYISNATGNTLNVSGNLYIDGTNNTLSIAPNTTVKIVYSTSASKWFRMFQN